MKIHPAVRHFFSFFSYASFLGPEAVMGVPIAIVLVTMTIARSAHAG